MKKVALFFLAFSIVHNLRAQEKINLDTLNYDQLILYKEKAIRMKTAGLILLFVGTGAFITGNLVAKNVGKNSNEDFRNVFTNISAALVIGGLVGTSASVTGISLIKAGNKRISRAEIALKKFDIKTNNSMALGLRIIFRFYSTIEQ